MRHVLSILLTATVLLAGCAHRISRETVEKGIITGKTTKQEVLNRFGAPYMRYRTPGMSIVSGKKEQMLHNAGEAWLYYLHYLGPLNITGQDTLRILFNDNGIVSSYAFTDATQAAPPE